MNKDNKYYNLIESLVKQNRKFPGYEAILDDIIDDVYSHSEVIINSIDNENVIKAYLEKVISTSIIVVPKRLNFNNQTSHRVISISSESEEQEKSANIKEPEVTPEPEVSSNVENTEPAQNEVEEVLEENTVTEKANPEFVDKMINTMNADLINTDDKPASFPEKELENALEQEDDNTNSAQEEGVTLEEDDLTLDVQPETLDTQPEVNTDNTNNTLEELSIEPEELSENNTENSNLDEDEELLSDISEPDTQNSFKDELNLEPETTTSVENENLQEESLEDISDITDLHTAEETAENEIPENAEETFDLQEEVSFEENNDLSTSEDLFAGSDNADNLTEETAEGAEEPADTEELLNIVDTNEGDDFSDVISSDENDNEKVEPLEIVDDNYEIEKDLNVSPDIIDNQPEKTDDIAQLDDSVVSADTPQTDADNLTTANTDSDMELQEDSFDILEADTLSEPEELMPVEDTSNMLEEDNNSTQNKDLDISLGFTEEDGTGIDTPLYEADAIDFSGNEVEALQDEASKVSDSTVDITKHKEPDYSIFSYTPDNEGDKINSEQIRNELIQLDKDKPDLNVLTVFDLRYKQNYTLEQIASKLNITKDKAASVLNEIVDLV